MRTNACTMEKVLICLLLFLTPAVCEANEPEQKTPAPGRERLLSASREIMSSAQFCSLITLDGGGQPRARVMDAFAPDEDFVVWLATDRRTRKVEQIMNDPRVTLYYFDPTTLGYVTLLGIADLVDDPMEKARRWKDGWEAFYPGERENFLLIRVVPRQLEIVSFAHEIGGDPETWTPLSVDFAGAESFD